MADKILASGLANIQQRYVDMGDETYAPLMATSSPALSSAGMTATVVNTAVVGDTTVSTATATQTTRVHRLRINVAGADTVQIKSGATVLETLNFTAAGFLVYDFSTRPWYVTATNTALVITNGSAVQLNAVFEFVKS